MVAALPMGGKIKKNNINKIKKRYCPQSVASM